MSDHDERWDEFEEERAAWLARLMFGRMLDYPIPAGPPPEPPEPR